MKRLTFLKGFLALTVAAIATVKIYDRPNPDIYMGLTAVEWRETANSPVPETRARAAAALNAIGIQREFWNAQGGQYRLPIKSDFHFAGVFK